MYILAPKMYILAPKMDKSVPFEKVQPQWQLLYLFFWECTHFTSPAKLTPATQLLQ